MTAEKKSRDEGKMYNVIKIRVEIKNPKDIKKKKKP